VTLSTDRPVERQAPRLSDTPGAMRSAGFIALFFCLGVFINSFTNLPLNFLLKERLHLDAWQLSRFGAVASWAWYVKPAFGLLTDRVPLWGSRRQSYLLLMGWLLAAVWSVLALAPAYQYGPLLGALALSALALAFMNTVTAGLLAELSQVSGASGRLNSLRQLATQGATLIAGPVGGYAAQYWSFQRVAGVAAAVAAVLLAGAVFLVREPRRGEDRESQPNGSTPEGPHPLKAAMQARAVWLALGFILLVELAPGFNTPLLFYQTDVLHFSKKFFGQLQLTGALAAIVGALVYARLCQRQRMRLILPAVLVLHAAATLTWLWLASPSSALLIKGLTGLTLVLTNLVIFDLATRAAPPGAEGTVLALLFTGVNIALMVSDLIGSRLYSWRWSLQSLVWLNAGTTLLAVFLVPLLPASLVARRDGEIGASS
jgi:predicted MFS family arabinose efflux permease